jgi:phosphoglycolate phosphatase-like HAD superfamily hydrolase
MIMSEAPQIEQPQQVAQSATQIEKKAKEYVIITDLNGTLIDSDQIMFDLMVGLLRGFGYEKKVKIILEEALRGTSEEEAMRQLGVDDEKQKELEKVLYKELEEKKINLLPNAGKALEDLQNEGFLFALATDLHHKYIVRLLNENNIQKFFREDLIFARDTFEFRKPSRNIVDEIFKRSGRGKGIVIGNSLKDVKMAANAEIPVIFLDYDPATPETDKEEEILTYYRKIKRERGGYQRISVVKDWIEIPKVIEGLISS